MQKNKNVLLPKFSNCLLKMLKPCVNLHLFQKFDCWLNFAGMSIFI